MQGLIQNAPLLTSATLRHAARVYPDVEIATAHDLYTNPKHPYTEALLSAVPIPDPTVKRKRVMLQGDVPSPFNPPKGCPFAGRCPLVMDKCRQQMPSLEAKSDGHQVACWAIE